jgi:hypothetical protein
MKDGDWLLIFEARLIEKGMSVRKAREYSNNMPVDWDTDPKDAADILMVDTLIKSMLKTFD